MAFDDDSWCGLVECEELIDLEEWAGVRGEPSPFRCPAVMTRALWDAISSGRRSTRCTDECVENVITAAKRALDRAASGEARADRAFVLHFAAQLPAWRGRPGWRPLQMLGGPSLEGKRRLVIALADEALDGPLPTDAGGDESGRD